MVHPGHLLIERFESIDVAFDGVLGLEALPQPISDLEPTVGVGDQGAQCPGQVVGVTGGVEQIGSTRAEQIGMRPTVSRE